MALTENEINFLLWAVEKNHINKAAETNQRN